MRGKKAKVREIKADIRYNNKTITKIINYVMQDGKKSVAEKNVYGALDILAEKSKMKQVEAFEKALENIKPKLEVKSRRVGGANYQVPMPVSDERQLTLALRWLIQAARDNRKNSTFEESLARELIAALNKEGNAFKKKEDVQKMAEANRAFAHFQW